MTNNEHRTVLEPAGIQWIEAPSAIRDGHWTDSDGCRWYLRGSGQAMPLKRIQHLVDAPDGRVILTAGPFVRKDVPVSEREALWQRISPYLRGSIKRSKNDHTDFRVGEFKNDQRRSLLIVEESC